MKWVIYRRDDPSPLLAAFLQEVRLTPRRLPDTEPGENEKIRASSKRRFARPVPRRNRPGARKSARR